jgi:hypothetical protein
MSDYGGGDDEMRDVGDAEYAIIRVVRAHDIVPSASL